MLMQRRCPSRKSLGSNGLPLLLIKLFVNKPFQQHNLNKLARNKSSSANSLLAMDLHGNRRKRHQKVVENDTLEEIYPHDMQLYKIPPAKEIQLSEFEDLAVQRLQVLRILEQATQKGHKIYSNDWKESIYSDLNKQNLKIFYRLAKSSGTQKSTESDLAARRADHISHFILRLAYCRSEELRRWFLYRELEWFKLRFGSLSPKSIGAFLALNHLTYVPISSEEKSRLQDELFQSTGGVYVVDSVDFYKVPYFEVASLVKRRRVYLEKGFAYIPSFELVTCILGIFRTLLSKALVYANQRLPLLDDDRTNFLISNLHQAYVGDDFSKRSDGKSISLSNIERFATHNFPLCMRHMHNVLKAEHHVKHGCRMQYGLFLKGIGLSFEDSMAFWREEFTKGMDGDKFDKQYAYGIKHNYGKVGNMTSYSAYSCIKIINGAVGPGEHHGCPFKHWDVSTLKTKFAEFGISSEGVEEVVEKVTNGHFQVACSKYFEHVYGRPIKNIVSHPNQYFEDSLDVGKVKEPKSSKKQKTSTVVDVTISDINWDEEMT